VEVGNWVYGQVLNLSFKLV